MKTTDSGKFRTKTTPYTVMSNYVLLDTNLDLATKGLYMLISHFITIPNFTLYKHNLRRETGLGECAFNRLWKQLKTAGYLLQHKLQDEKGIFYYEYELLDQPVTENPPLDESPAEPSPTGETPSINNTLKNNSLVNKSLANKQEQQQEDLAPVVLDTDILTIYKRAFGKVPTTLVTQRLQSYLHRFEKDVVLMALEIAGAKHKGIDYAYGILRMWGQIEAYTMDQVFAYEEGCTVSG